MAALQGYRTYICTTICALAGFAFAMGWITQEQLNAVLAIFGSMAMAALRSGVNKGGQ